MDFSFFYLINMALGADLQFCRSQLCTQWDQFPGLTQLQAHTPKISKKASKYFATLAKSYKPIFGT